MNSYLVIILTLVVSGLNFVYGILNTRFLGVSDIGIYSLLVQSINTIILISDFGLSTAFLKFYSLAFTKDKNQSNKIIQNSFFLKGLISLFLITISLMPVALFRNSFFKELNLFDIILLMTTLFTIGISELMMSKYRSEGRFKSFFIYKFIFAFLRIIPMTIFYIQGEYTLEVSLGIFSLSTLVMVILLMIEQRNMFKNISFDKNFIKELIHFSKWIFVSNIALAFLTNGTIELYLLKHFSDKENLGYFSAILIFFTILNVLNSSITTLFFPKFSSLDDNKKLELEVKKAFKISVVLSVPLLLLIPFIEIFIKLTIGEKFLDAGNIARVLLLGFFIELSFQGYRLVLYIKGNKKIAFINAVQFFGSLILGLLLIGVFKLGAMGAVISIFIIRVSGAFYMWKSYKKVMSE